MKRKVIILLLSFACALGVIALTACNGCNGCNGCGDTSDEQSVFSESDVLTHEHNYSDWFSFYATEISCTVYARCCLECEIVEYQLSNEETVYTSDEFEKYIENKYPVEVHLHKNISAIEGVPPTCTKMGYLYKIKCDDCNAIIYTAEVNALGHAWSAVEQISPCKERVVCQRCEFSSEQTSHDLIWRTITEPTCAQEGVRVCECKRCDYSAEESISALEHKWKITSVEKAAPTKNGWVKYVCRICGLEKETTLFWIEENDNYLHNWETIMLIEPTCLEDGFMLLQCAICEKTIGEEIKALGHNWKEIYRDAPTCTQTGFVKKHCNRCSVEEEGTLDALGHEIDVMHNDHVHIEQCTRCKEEYDTEVHDLFVEMQTISKELETEVEYTTVFSYECYGFKTMSTDNCDYGKEITRDTIRLPKNEKFEEIYLMDVIDPTCTKDGLFILKLKSTGGEISRTVIPATGHWLDYNGICMRCGLEDFTKGLEYTLSDDETYYIVSGIGESTDTEIVIPSVYNNLPVKTIGNLAFSDCSSLTGITIPNSVTSIGNCAFANCSSLTGITIPNSVNSIKGSVFYGCWSLTSITVDARNTTYHSDGNCIIETASKTLIGGCKSSIIPTNGSVTSIGHFAFDGCSGLTEIIIPDSVTSIGGRAFENCGSLTKINIPSGATFIGEMIAFYGCYSLTEITVAEDHSIYQSIDGNLYTKDGSTLIQYAVGKAATKFIIPDSVTSIGDCAFGDCGLTSVTIPNSVTSIGDFAFSHTRLTEIIIPNSVTSIGMGAFSDCFSLTSVTIPNSVTSIGMSAFFRCSSLTEIIIPNSVNSIAEYMFAECNNLTKITISNSVTSIGHEAFYGCSSLTSITIPDSVTSIGVLAFENCSSLIQTENGISYVDKWVVDCDNSITTVKLRTDTKGIVSNAFNGCTSLTSITIPNSVTSIGNFAFYDCISLTSVTFENTSGWRSTSDYHGVIEFSSINLANTTIAAEYLTGTYCGDWIRSDK